jgi:hypothetical protein
MPLPPDIPPAAVPFLERAGYLDDERLAAGRPAPDLTLFTMAGEPVRLQECWAAGPAVLIFGSFT